MNKPGKISKNKEYSYGQGLKLLQHLFDEGQFIFTTKEIKPLIKHFNISENYLLSSLLTRLEKSNWIIKIKRGLYAGTGMLPGNTETHPFAIATRLVEPSSISHWSALHYYGMTEQIPHIVTATTTKKVLTPSMRAGIKEKTLTKHLWCINDQLYEYITVQPNHYFGIVNIWVDQRFKIPITDKERTILDCFAYLKMFGGIGEVINILDENINALDVEKLISYCAKYNKPTVAKRLGWALEQSGISNKVTLPLYNILLTGFALLDPTLPRTGVYNKYWKIQNNITGNKSQ